MRITSFVIILLAILPMILFIFYTDIAAEEYSETEILIWDKTTEGPIYNYDITESGIIPDEKTYDGYADGNGNIYLKGFDVASNQTLIIRPGVTILFNAKYPNQFEVWGSIQALGTKAEPIVFTSNKSNPKFNDWDGITIREKFSGETTFKHCKFEYCWDIEIRRNATFENCDFYKTQGLHIQGYDKGVEFAYVSNCTMTGDVDGYETKMGFELFALKIRAYDNVMEDKNSHFFASSSEQLEFCRNYVKGGSDKNVKAAKSNPGDNEFIVADNTIIDQDFHVYGAKNVIGNTVTNGVLHLSGPQVVKDNIVTGGLFLDFYWQPEVRNNNFDAYVSYLNPNEKSEPIDLSYNSWGRDWYIEDLLGLEIWPEIRDYIIFEPYYDKNGTLTDNDGIPNGWEIYHGFDIYSDDSGIDDDEDGLTRLEEWEQGGGYLIGGCDPKNPDTDGDGLTDGFEVENGYNATFYDSDLDGMSDGWEYNNSLDPLVDDHIADPDADELSNLGEFLNGTNPNNPDSDEDKMPDGWEVNYGFDPLDKEDADEDYDEDGWSNKEEFEAGTSPINDESHPKDPPNGFDLLKDTNGVICGVSIILAILLIFCAIFWVQKKGNKKSDKDTKPKKSEKEEPAEAKIIED